MTTLVEFLEAQLAEDEANARAATAGPWRYNPGKQWIDEPDAAVRDLLVGVGVTGDEYVGAGPITAAVCVAATGPADDPQSMADARFIAAHDPARVLREVEAKRRIVAIHSRRAEAYPDTAGGTFENCCQGCGFDGCCDDPIVEDVEDCPELRALAAVWSDHPGYRSEWAS